jgi:streptogramin lyase
MPTGHETGTLELVSLTSGGQTRVAVPVGSASSSQLAWAPDSTWLFVITANGGLGTVNPRTGQVVGLGLGIAGLSHIAIRAAA